MQCDYCKNEMDKAKFTTTKHGGQYDSIDCAIKSIDPTMAHSPSAIKEYLRRL